MGRVLNELGVGLAISFVSNFFMNRRSAILDDRLEHHQRVESSVRVRREHFLLDLLNCILRPTMGSNDDSSS